MEKEIPLTGGRMTAGVVRIGNTVRRPIKAGAAFAHELLRHFEGRGFTGAPRFLGVDSAGREILSFIPGSVPPDLGSFSSAQLRAAAKLLRHLHDATLDSVLRSGYEVVCHGDASPCNCVFMGDMPIAFIDFDAAHPGSRLEDLGYAAWLWINIGDDDFSVESQGQRVADFFRNYGMSAENAVSAILAAQESLEQRTSAPEVREWSRICLAWVEKNHANLAAAIAVHSKKALQSDT